MQQVRALVYRRRLVDLSHTPVWRMHNNLRQALHRHYYQTLTGWYYWPHIAFLLLVAKTSN